mmetsp:Transcript_22634/g.52248  ORF Transcript_22634/g.52248 Transcript_22634/m.52248 type:complete len:108 (+) Transcript_22634:298-621(+)
MHTLSLIWNRLSGQLPSEIGLLTRLSTFSGGWGFAFGVLHLSDLFLIGKLALDGNIFSGVIPNEVCGLRNLNLASVSNANMDCSLIYGGLTCPTQACCPIKFCPSVP